MMDEAVAPDLSGSIGALSAAVLGAAMDMAGLGVMVTDAALDPPGPAIRYVNARCEAMTGYDAAELIGHTPRILQGPETDRAELDRLLRELKERQHFIGATTNYRHNGEPFLMQWIILPIRGADGAVTHWLSIQRDSTGHGVPAEALQLRTAELLGTVRAIGARTLMGTESAAFGDRLAALGRTQGLPIEDARLEAMLRDALHPFAVNGQVTLEGPEVALPRGVAEPLALALHELASNAARHGALATQTGRLFVSWRIQGAGVSRRLLIDWRESGVHLPEEAGRHKGYGRAVIEEALAFALGGETQLGFEADGLACRIALPLAE
ncbi:PAS domain-containing protein [Roseomonas xinghualingensis]|uniref:PAS domain-containing protein n=1 Tax=Roseomonas xinghualingensis TaxID=2986475 RepID=UPI0021F16FD9|nr:PAS domain-containing protein [Roseomonas sp. SXEYE001]MCV4205991.1 PAS domain S-box protein [Roseomonas sp. SXEYE001]